MLYAVIVTLSSAASTPVLTPASGLWCSQSEVNFTCAVEGAQTLAWMSDEYIGSGGDHLAFSIEHRNGTEKSNERVNGTYALLVGTDGEGKLVSILHLYMQFNGTVTCMVLDPPGLMTNVTISINGN